jgi:signal transduction histidine kinase
MKNIKASSYLFVLIAVFLTASFVGYKLLHYHISTDQNQATKILFYEIRNHTSHVLTKLFSEYNTQEGQLLEKHKTVLEYMKSRDLNVSLDAIHGMINEGHADKPYNIYITDKNLVIQNTTYAPDMGFDLSFAKKTFELHKADNTIGCSLPIHEDSSSQFFGFTDSYLAKNGDERAAILQISYLYKSASDGLLELQNLIDKHSTIVNIKAYGIDSTGYIYDIILKESDKSHDANASLKPDPKEIVATMKDGHDALLRMKNFELIQNKYTKGGKHYRDMQLVVDSALYKDIKVLYNVLLDESEYYDRLNRLNIVMIFLSIAGVLGIIFANKMRNEESRLSMQDQFVQNAMHEIKTPLSIITLNNELRALEYGKDPYGEEIEGALGVLHNSYSSMGFVVTKDKIVYESEMLDLGKIVKERIDFFQIIARANEKFIDQAIESNCSVKISRVELMRLIDNNLSNAVKYSTPGSHITVTLNDGLLTFHNFGEPIIDKVKIFHHYFRENTTVGGYGLGLGIVNEIARKHHIEVEVRSDASGGNIFAYRFKCHKNITS